MSLQPQIFYPARRVLTAILPLFLLAISALGRASAAEPDLTKLPPAAKEKVDFVHDVQPLLARCTKCHGAEKQESGLRLHKKAEALAGGDNGVDIKPGDSAHSRLVQFIAGLDSDELMPPKGDGERLSAEQVGVIRAWIDQGANWPDAAGGEDGKSSHWAYQKLVRPAVPQVSLANWPKNPIDNFILARLEKEKLSPSPELDRPRLLRRLSLDLIGLPPTPEETAAFVGDQSADAYEKQVDRLLASPRYGERWARPWLDMARYADTDGFEKDPRRSMWPYRDWVINAINADMPFDEFTIEQLAGDLLPNATTAQKIATGFHRNTMINTEGGVDQEEYRVATVIDRVNTTATVWLGTTMACDRCHSHKFDPFKQKEYFQLYAFFNSTADANGVAPELEYDSPAAAGIKAEVARLTAEFIAPNDELDDEQDAWEASFDDAGRKKLPRGIRDALAVAPAKRTAQQEADLTETFRQMLPEYKARLKELKDRRAAMAQESAKTMIMQELAKPRVTNIQLGGNFLSKGEAVSPGVPAVLPPLPEGQPANRLTLARWLVSADNPLTPRVTANRAWEKIFGHGLVLTSEDFGTQGERPSHPELLDWLASELLARHWSMKALHRLIVTSATYRQSSKATADLLERDPYNRLLARGPRFRLEAEAIRDQALSVAGLLSGKIGGPSVMPPQPDGVWSNPYSGDRWVTSTSEDKYRRGLYTFWRRTAAYPEFMSFDAPSREYCIVRRSRSNTPLQALTVLNDPVYVEAAQALARRMLTGGIGFQPVREGIDGTDRLEAYPTAAHNAAERARRGFRLCLTREPTPTELERLIALHDDELKRFRGDAKAAAEMLKGAPSKPGEPALDPADWAAWTVVANVLLNLDETLTKG